MAGRTSLRHIRPGALGVRYASDRDHKIHGWIFDNCACLRDAIHAADFFLKDRNFECVPLLVVDHKGEIHETVSWERD